MKKKVMIIAGLLCATQSINTANKRGYTQNPYKHNGYMGRKNINKMQCATSNEIFARVNNNTTSPVTLSFNRRFEKDVTDLKLMPGESQMVCSKHGMRDVVINSPTTNNTYTKKHGTSTSKKIKNKNKKQSAMAGDTIKLQKNKNYQINVVAKKHPKNSKISQFVLHVEQIESVN